MLLPNSGLTFSKKFSSESTEFCWAKVKAEFALAVSYIRTASIC
jgi:hypothetical protein